MSKNNSGGSPGPEHAESGGKSPLVSVEYSERGRLTSERGYSPAWKTLWESSVHKSLFGVLILIGWFPYGFNLSVGIRGYNIIGRCSCQ